MKKIGLVAATMLAAVTLIASPIVTAENQKGVCQCGQDSRNMLDDAMAKYWRWYLGGVGPQEVGQLFFVPMPNGEQISEDPFIYQGSESFTIRSDKTLVLPMSFFLGESYVEGPPDNPADFPTDYKPSSLLLTVDGRVILDSTRTKLDCVYVDYTYFRKPIKYPEPTEYGSDAAIWMVGLGILLPPMPPGQHVIDLQVVSPFSDGDFGFYNTWYVTVTNQGKRHK